MSKETAPGGADMGIDLSVAYNLDVLNCTFFVNIMEFVKFAKYSVNKYYVRMY